MDAVDSAVFARCGFAFLFEHFRQMAMVAESGGNGYVVDGLVGFFQHSAGNIEPLLNDILSGTYPKYSHEHALKMRYRHAIFGSFLCFFNSPAALAAGEIRVQKKRVVSDAPGLWSVVLLFMVFSLVFY